MNYFYNHLAATMEEADAVFKEAIKKQGLVYEEFLALLNESCTTQYQENPRHWELVRILRAQEVLIGYNKTYAFVFRHQPRFHRLGQMLHAYL
jgi:hypothetical protein